MFRCLLYKVCVLVLYALLYEKSGVTRLHAARAWMGGRLTLL